MEGADVLAEMRAVVIGGGLGGLAVALRLRVAGCEVTVCDNGPAFGGKMNRWSAQGYIFDTGPTLLTMPHILRRLYADIGERMEDHLELAALDPHAEYIYPDGFRIAVPARLEEWLEVVRRTEPGDAKGVRRLHALGERIYRLSEYTFFRDHPLTPLRLPPPVALRHLPLRYGWGNYARTVNRFLKNPRLRQLYNRYPTYVGSSPYRCPATLLVIPYIEHVFGAWCVKGGMYRIVESLTDLARRRGVELLPGSPVAEIEHEGGRVTGVRLENGARIPASAAVFNGDAATLGGLLGGRSDAGPESRSLSGVVLLLGLRKRLPVLHHHTVLFSPDYAGEFDALFAGQRFPPEPTVYMNAPNDPSLAPPGGQALFLMANAPGDGSTDWDEATIAEAKQGILRRVRQAGVPDLEAMAEVCDVWHPGRFARRYLAPGGAIYGANSHGWRRAFLRPANRDRRYRGLYCVGGSFHPGGGVPMVLLSAEITAGLMREDWGS
jgi:phytoene desaturase